MDTSDPDRDAIHDALQQHSGTAASRGGLLTGWVVVTEWMDPDGERWLNKAHSANIPSWTANGYHHEALYGDWPDD